MISTSFGSVLLLLYPKAFPVSSTRCLKNDRKASRGHARRSDLTFIVLAICFNMKLMLCEPTHVMFHSPVYDQLIVYDQGKRKTLGLRDASLYYGYAVTISILIKCHIIRPNWDANCFIYVKLMHKTCLIFLRSSKILMHIKISKRQKNRAFFLYWQLQEDVLVVYFEIRIKWYREYSKDPITKWNVM